MRTIIRNLNPVRKMSHINMYIAHRLSTTLCVSLCSEDEDLIVLQSFPPGSLRSVLFLGLLSKT